MAERWVSHPAKKWMSHWWRLGGRVWLGRDVDDEAVEGVADDDLAGEAACPLPFRHEIQDVPLVAHGVAYAGEPVVGHEAVAGRAGAAAPALRVDASDAVVYGAVHDRGADRRRMGLATSVAVYEHDGGHRASNRRQEQCGNVGNGAATRKSLRSLVYATEQRKGTTLIVIGLTGGIASGKSTAARHLGERGATVIDADKLGHRAYDPGTPGFDKVAAAFGPEVVSDGQIDRKALGGKVFGDPAQLKRLTDIVWPEILDLAKADISAAKARGASVVVLEAAVLLEAGWEDEVDEVWVVTVEPAVAVERASARDGVDAAAVQARIDAQLSNAERTPKADAVIDNSGAEADLLSALDREWQRLQKETAA